MKNNLVSVIVPIYNVEEYLPECIESLISQTYDNLEIILVDDGSSDNCGKICDTYAQKDNRIKVIHKENGGFSDARNAGINIASGEFISFVDSDDFVDAKYIEHLMTALNLFDADISIGNLIIYDSKINKKNVNLNDNIILEKEQLIPTSFDEQLFWILSHGRLYKKKVMENIMFNSKMKMSEDVEFFYNVLLNTKKIVVTPTNDYFYRIRENSATKCNFNLNKWNFDFEYNRKLIEENEDVIIKRSLIRRYYRVCTNCIINYNLSKKDYKIIKKNMSEYKKIFWFESNLKEKIKFIICYYLPSFKYFIKFKKIISN